MHHPFVESAFFLKLLGGLVAGFLLIGALTAVPTQLRKPVIRLFTFFGGLYYSAEFFLPTHKLPDGTMGNFLTPSLPEVGNVSNVVVTFSYGLGVISLLGIHAKNVNRKRDGWPFSIVVIVSFFVMLLIGLMNKYAPATRLIPATHFIGALHASDVYGFLFNGGLTALDSAMFALIAFFIVSASYRAFRIRSVESTLLMGSALIVMLGQVTLGTAITSGLSTKGFAANFRMENLAQYILLQINAPALRAIVFGIAVGFLATSLRIWLSLERGAFFDQEA